MKRRPDGWARSRSPRGSARIATSLTRSPATDGSRGSFAPLAALHKRIDKEFTYDPAAGRFTPKNALGIAAETLDALHAAKDEAEKSGMYKKMQSGDPNDIFDAAEQYGKVFDKLSKTTLAPKRLVPTYKMLVESSKPPLSDDAKALALIVAEDPKQWDALLKRSVLDPEAGRPVHLRGGRGDGDGPRPAGVAGRPAHAGSGSSWCGSGSRGSTRAGRSSRPGGSSRATTSPPRATPPIAASVLRDRAGSDRSPPQPTRSPSPTAPAEPAPTEPPGP